MSAAFAHIAIFMRGFAGRRPPRAVVERAARWSDVAANNPALVEDMVILGEIVALGAVDETNKLQSSALELAYERGRRDLAIEILAMMQITPFEINQLLKESLYETERHDL